MVLSPKWSILQSASFADAAGVRTVQCAYVVLLFSRMAKPYQTLYITCSPTHMHYTHGPVQSSSLLYTQRERLLIFNCPEVVQ